VLGSTVRIFRKSLLARAIVATRPALAASFVLGLIINTV